MRNELENTEQEYEAQISQLLNQFDSEKSKFNITTLPTTTPATLLEHLDSSFVSSVSTTQIKDYAEFWTKSGRDFIVLANLLSHVTIVTPELENEAFTACANILQDLAKKNMPVAVIGAGGKGQKKVFSFAAISQLPTEHSNLLLLPQNSEEILGHFGKETRPILALLDDWSFSGGKFEQYLEQTYLDIVEATNNQTNPELHAVVSGVTARSLSESSVVKRENIHAYYQIPLISQMYDKDSYEKLLRESFSHKDKNAIFQTTGYGNKGLTIAYDRIPDSWCIPDILLSSGGLTAENGRKYSLLHYSKGR